MYSDACHHTHKAGRPSSYVCRNDITSITFAKTFLLWFITNKSQGGVNISSKHQRTK